MGYEWNADKLQYMKNAVSYSDYYETLSREILKMLGEEKNICDVGCGLGYLSLALSSQMAVTAVDRDETVMAFLQQKICEEQKENLTALCQDAFLLDASSRFDAAVFCFFGEPEEILGFICAHVRSKAIVVRKNWEYHRFSIQKKPLTGFTLQSTCQIFDKMGIPYSTKTFLLDMGQPFRSMEDAVRFFRVWHREETVTSETIAPRLQKTQNAEFPLYLPSENNLGLILLDANQVREVYHP